MKYKTALFNGISSDYSKPDEKYIEEYWKNCELLIIDHNLSFEEYSDLEVYLSDESALKKIEFKESVDLETILRVNTIISQKQKEVTQNIYRTLTENEIKTLSEFEFMKDDMIFSTDALTGKRASLKEYKAYNSYKDELLTVIKELDLSELEASAYIYGKIRDNFVLNNNEGKTIYQTVIQGSGNNESINLLMSELLKSAGINSTLNIIDGVYVTSVEIKDQKYGAQGNFNLDVITDMNIAEVLGTEELYTKFMEGLDKKTIDAVVETINRKMRSLENIIEKEQSDNSEIEISENKSIGPIVPNDINEKQVIMDNTMTFALPIEEIREASKKESVKEILPNSNICSEFLEKEMIEDENGLGEFLIRYGANKTIVEKIINNNVTNYYKVLEGKKDAKILFEKKDNTTQLYVPTTEEDNHSMKITINEDQSVTIVNSEYLNFMDGGVRYGSTSILDLYLNKNNEIEIKESLNRISEVQNVTPNMILPVYDVTAEQQMLGLIENKFVLRNSDRVNVICTKSEGKLVASTLGEEEKVLKARNLGFDEKYYGKKKIAGLNKYSTGEEVYLTEEDMMDYDETGLVASEEVVLVKSSGKAHILLISMIVGFTIGIGIGLGVLLLNFVR